MRVLCFGCLHYPQNKEEFIKTINKIDEKIDLILISGDLAETTFYYYEVYDMIKDLSKNIFAIFGNIEKSKDEIINQCKKIKFLDDVSATFNKYLIIGTTGSTEENPLHLKRIKFVEEKLKRGKEYYQTIVLMHYVPSSKLLMDEERRNFRKMGSNDYERIFEKYKPNLVIYAHSHSSLPLQTIKGIPFLNSSFYSNKGILLFNLF